MAYWLTSGSNPDADYTQTLNPHTGSLNLAHWDDAAYQVYTYQSLTDLEEGRYTLTAWVKSTGGQNACYLNAKNYGGVELSLDLPVTETYIQVEIPNIIVTAGQCTIGLWSDSPGGNRATMDDVEFIKVDDCGFYIEDLFAFSSDWLRGTEVVAVDTLHQYRFDGGTLDTVDPNGIDLVALDGASAEGALDTYDGVSGDGPVAYAASNPLPLSDFTGADGAFTLEAFIRPDVAYGTQPHTMQILSMDNNGLDAARGWHFGIGTDNTLYFKKITGTYEAKTAAIPTAGEHAYAAGSWYHVAVTYNGQEGTPDNLKLYWTKADSGITHANLLGSFMLSEDLNPAVSSNFAVGNELRTFGGYSENFEGLIDEVRISSVARGPSEMLKSSNSDPMTSDFSGNGVVDLVDFSVLCEDWIKCGSF